MADAAAPREEGERDEVLSLEQKTTGNVAEEPATDEGVELRENFSETAFFEPHLLLDADGAATVEFVVPDSVTEWNVWVHGMTNDLRAGSIQKQTRSVKELMVRPYLPRFLREGDRAAIRVVVNNAGENQLDGALDFEITDPETGEDLRGRFGLDAAAATQVAFSVDPGQGTTLEFPVIVPARIGTVAFTATARAGSFSDGERRPLPVLPGRMHLAQSRFVTLRDEDRRELDFSDMRADDPTTIIDAPKTGRALPKYLSEDEVDLLLGCDQLHPVLPRSLQEGAEIPRRHGLLALGSFELQRNRDLEPQK